MHQVKTCCCGCSLKTGTLILVILSLLGILDLIGKLANPKSVPAASLGLELIFVITAIPALYGTLKEKATWLIPHLVAYVASLVLIIIGMIAILIFGQVIIYAIIPMADADPNEKKKAEAGIIVITIISEVALAIGAALTYYFFVVIYSFYKLLKTKTGGLPA